MNYLLLVLIFFAGLILGIFLPKIQKPKKKDEIIRCKDCEHYEYDEFTESYCCMEWGYQFPDENEFCSRAERRCVEIMLNKEGKDAR